MATHPKYVNPPSFNQERQADANDRTQFSDAMLSKASRDVKPSYRVTTLVPRFDPIEVAEALNLKRR